MLYCADNVLYRADNMLYCADNVLYRAAYLTMMLKIVTTPTAYKTSISHISLCGPLQKNKQLIIICC